MRRFVEKADRGQWTLLPECLDDFIDESNPVRVIDVFVDVLDLADMTFEGWRRRRQVGHRTTPRFTAGDGGGHDDAGMRRARNHKSRASGRRSRRRRHRPTHTLPSTRASRETTWQQELASLHSERPDWDNRTRTGPAPGWRPLWSRSDVSSGGAPRCPVSINSALLACSERST